MKQILSKIFILLFLAVSTTPSSASFIIHHPHAFADSSKSDSVNFSGALNEFTHLSKKERRLRIKDANSAIKDYKAQKKAGAESSTNQLLLVILAILLPPLAVYLHEGAINNKFWLDLLLTILFFLPGVIYALIVVLAK